MSDPAFGDAVETRAELSVCVRRPLNGFSGLDEVFEFYLIEPSVDQADREPFPHIKYHITRENRTGVPGVDSPEISLSLRKPGLVPDDVMARAEAMLGYAVVNPEVENGDE